MNADPSKVHFLENVGPIGLGVDKESHEILMLLRTPVGVLSEALTRERALQLGIELIRISGQRFRFQAAGPSPDSEEVPNDAQRSRSGGGDRGAGAGGEQREPSDGSGDRAARGALGLAPDPT